MRREYIIDLPDISLEENTAGKIANLDMDAVFCSNDFMAGHLIKRLRAQGMRVPQDIAIMGFDGIDSICDLVDPPLTSLRQPVEEIARLTVNLMMEKLKGREVEEKIYYVNPTLRIGKSCGC